MLPKGNSLIIYRRRIQKMKKSYIEPELNLIPIELKDVLALSPGQDPWDDDIYGEGGVV